MAGVPPLLEGLLVPWEMVAANNNGVCHGGTACGVSSDSAPSDSARQAQHDGADGDTGGSRGSDVAPAFKRGAESEALHCIEKDAEVRYAVVYRLTK
jgi:hypothetical protein